MPKGSRFTRRKGEQKVVSGSVVRNCCYKRYRIQRITLLNLAMDFITAPLQILSFMIHKEYCSNKWIGQMSVTGVKKRGNGLSKRALSQLH